MSEEMNEQTLPLSTYGRPDVRATDPVVGKEWLAKDREMDRQASRSMIRAVAGAGAAIVVASVVYSYLR